MRKHSYFNLVLAILLAGILSGCGGGSKTPPSSPLAITVDGNDSEWNLPGPSADDSGLIAVSGSRSMYIWKDKAGDERADFSPSLEVDLTEFRLIADSTNLYFLIRINDIVQTSGNGVAQVRISIDTDRISGSGNSNCSSDAETQVPDNARWERLLITRFGSTGGNVNGIGANWQVLDTAYNPTFAGFAVNSATNDLIEASIPWSSLGATQPNGSLRLTVCVYKSNALDTVWDTDGTGSQSNGLDCITTDGGNTWDELSDGVINYYIDLTFAADGTVSITPPL